MPVGKAENGGPVGLSLARLLDGRLLIQGSSGAGKSWTLRRLLEQTAGRIQQIVIDPEGEFRSFAEAHGLVVLDHQLDRAALITAAERAREHRVSVLLDLSDLDREAQMAAATAFLTTIVAAPREFWTPVLVAIDEAHLFAPYGTTNASPHIRKASIDAVADLMSRGRKRGLCGVVATQRLVKLSKSVASEAGNVIIGRNTLELDISRAAEAIGWPDRKAQDRLPNLPIGAFVAVGPAFTRSPVVVGIGPVMTRHRGSTPRLVALPAPRADSAEMLDIEELLATSAVRAAARASHNSSSDIMAVRAFAADPASLNALRVLTELRHVRPLPLAEAGLGPRLALREAELGAALSLLEDYGLVAFGTSEGGRTARAMP